MTLASHARGTKVLVMMYDNDRPDAARRGHAGDGSSWKLVEEALVMIQACIKCSPHIIQTWKGVELSHTSFFKTGWEYIAWPDFESYGSRSRDTLTAHLKLLAPKRNMHLTFLWEQQHKHLKSICWTIFCWWWRKSTSQHPEVVQDRGHGPGARASPTLDPWTWLKQYS